MTPYLPTLGGLAAVLITWGIAGLLLLAGAGLIRSAPEIQIASGWGALSLWLTSWGVFTSFPLYGPAIALMVAALLVLLLKERRPARGAWSALGRMLALSLPLWLVMAAIRPSQPDTFLNLLPNAFYLVDHGRFPAAGLPPSFSYLPGAPYNTQFLSFLGSFLEAGYPAPGMSLVNVMLTLLAGLAIARTLGRTPSHPDGTPPSWGLTATGFLLATLLNPGFVPRVNFSAMGETAMAVTALFSAVLIVEGLGHLAERRPPAFLPLGLVLAAMINAKQSAIGLFLALLLAALLTGWAEGAAKRAPLCRFLAVAAVPAVILYAIWRYYMAGAGVAELRPLPLASWNWSDLPLAISSALSVAGEKITYFVAVGAAFALLALLLRRQGWTATTRLLFLHAALFVFYNAFLALTYVAVFPADMGEVAHSFFRYNTHLSLILVLSLSLALRDLGIVRSLSSRGLRAISGAILALALLTPIAFARRLRFDLRMPQPIVWDLARKIAPYLDGRDRLALLLPGDNGSLKAMLSGLLRLTPPRHPELQTFYRPRADMKSLEAAARRGYALALVSCTPAGLLRLPPRQAALLSEGPGGWREIALWPYPAISAPGRWQQIVSWRPLCREE